MIDHQRASDYLDNAMLVIDVAIGVLICGAMACMAVLVWQA